jgi:hypothetical protein
MQYIKVNVINYENEDDCIQLHMFDESKNLTLHDILKCIYESIPKKCYFFQFDNPTPTTLRNDSFISTNSLFYLSYKAIFGLRTICRKSTLTAIEKITPFPKDILCIIRAFLVPTKSLLFFSNSS